MELFKIKKDIPFMSYGKVTTSISLVTFLLAILFLATKGLNFGVDFTGREYEPLLLSQGDKTGVNLREEMK